MTIKAVTLDFWDTIVADDSDEPKRAALGLRSKRDERRHLVWQTLDAVEPIDYEKVALTYDTADAGFNVVWRELHINWTLEQRLRVVLNGLDRKLSNDAFAKLVADTGRMEVDIPPDPIAGVKGALDALSRKYTLAIVSDAIVTPGSGLRQILAGHGLEHYFSSFAFSDEVGHSKPHRSMFDTACRQAGVDVQEIVHIGDRDHNDVQGSQALGAKAVLFTATRDADKATTTADAVCASYDDLPGVIDKLAGAG